MHLLIFDSASAAAQACADIWSLRLRENPHLALCLASGNSPKPLYAAMQQRVTRRLASFAQATIFALDEYGGLAPDDPGCCKNMLQHDLLDGVDLPSEQFVAFDPHAPDLESMCADFDRATQPGFDLSILGLGLNGHLGINEPGTAPDAPTRRVQLAASTTQGSASYLKHNNLPTWGFTVGLKTLLASREVWVLATGASKTSIVTRLLREEPSPALPAAWLKQHPNSWLMLDHAAAGDLSLSSPR